MGIERRWAVHEQAPHMSEQTAHTGTTPGGRTRARVHPEERGIALVVVLVAISALTVLGVASLATSNTDGMVANNLRRMDQARYAAIAGTEHAKRELVLGKLPTSAQTSYFDESSDSSTYFIDSSSAIAMSTANGSPLGTYQVKAISIKCSGAPPGYSIDHFYSQYFDLKATGIIKDNANTAALPASATSVLTVRKVADGRCFRR